MNNAENIIWHLERFIALLQTQPAHPDPEYQRAEVKTIRLIERRLSMLKTRFPLGAENCSKNTKSAEITKYVYNELS